MLLKIPLLSPLRRYVLFIALLEARYNYHRHYHSAQSFILTHSSSSPSRGVGAGLLRLPNPAITVSTYLPQLSTTTATPAFQRGQDWSRDVVVHPPTAICMANSKIQSKNKKQNSSKKPPAAGLKGFGSSATLGSVGGSSAAATKTVTGKARVGGGGIIDRSPMALKFYDYLERNGAGSNLKRVGLGNFPLSPTSSSTIIEDVNHSTKTSSSSSSTLRGVMALRDISKGETIIEIPYEMALNLGRESADPTLPATTLLQKYCTWKCSSSSSSSSSKSITPPPGDRDRGDYFAMLPPYHSNDCLSSTDFFSNTALDMLQSPLIVEETLARRQLIHMRYERDVEPMFEISSNLYRWFDHPSSSSSSSSSSSENYEKDIMWTTVTQSHLQWATWIITSRVLTVQGAPKDAESSSSSYYRLLIPFIDMCNHDRDSPHILTGRAMPGGMLKVVAGADIKLGEAINIGYGGGVEGNDRFIQDYGFLDSGGSKEQQRRSDNRNEIFVPEAYKIVARRLLGRVVGGRSSSSIGKLTAAETERALNALKQTCLEEDETLLTSGTILKSDERMALEYRIGIKRALQGLTNVL